PDPRRPVGPFYPGLGRQGIGAFETATGPDLALPPLHPGRLYRRPLLGKLEPAMNHSFFLAAVALTAFSGVPGLFFNRRSMAGQIISILFFCAGSLAGLAVAFQSFSLGTGDEWALPVGVCGGKVSFLIDPLAAVFLTSIFLICTMGSLHGLE